MRRLFILLWLLWSSTASADSWSGTKAKAASVYEGHHRTIYCDCPYDDKKRVDVDACGLAVQDKWPARAKRIEWEHIVPASLMPARVLPCWEYGGRRACERDPVAQVQIFDLHNLAPAVGQLNAYRSNDRYGEAEGVTWGSCAASDSGPVFEPPDSVKGDVARVWLYMRHRYRLWMTPEERIQMVHWSADDPVDEWELERDRRIEKLQGNSNPFVRMCR